MHTQTTKSCLFRITTFAIGAGLAVALAAAQQPQSASAASAAQPVYIVSGGLGPYAVFGKVDPATGAFRQIGPTEPDGYFGLVPGPHGTIVSMTYTGILVSINPGTGVPTTIGPTGLGPCPTPNSPSCGSTSAFTLGGFDGRIYATDFGNNIYTVNPSTGAATPLTMNSGIPPSPFVLASQNPDGTVNVADEAIWESGGKLYATYDAWILDPNTLLPVGDPVVSPFLYEIDPATGKATAIGPTELGIGAVVVMNGVNYAFDDITNQILELDLTTGNTSPTGISFSPAAGVIQGAAPVSGRSFRSPIR
jgi:hypothetical protein